MPHLPAPAQAQGISLFIMALIAISCTTFVVETLPYFQENPSPVWCVQGEV